MKQVFKIASNGVKLKKINVTSIGFRDASWSKCYSSTSERVKRVMDTIKVEDNYQPLLSGLHLKNMHLWHGFVVTPGPMVATFGV
jgi:hypothetical protein